MIEIPLFPLSAVLVPGGRMPLQIFERRYIDLVRRCLREDIGFGIVWIRDGAEIDKPGNKRLDLGDIGTLARIVDWDQLPNGLLGITVEGHEKFTLKSGHTADDDLVMGQVEMHAPLPPVPMEEDWDQLVEVLQSLQTHPHVQRLHLEVDYENAWQVGYTLVQLLPLEEDLKFDLLEVDNVPDLMSELDLVLNRLGNGD